MTTNKKVAEPIEVEVSTTIPQSAKQSNKNSEVEIVTKTSFKVFYGDRWYFFTQGNTVKVPQELKEYLLKQDALAVM